MSGCAIVPVSIDEGRGEKFTTLCIVYRDSMNTVTVPLAADPQYAYYLLFYWFDLSKWKQSNGYSNWFFYVKSLKQS